MSVSENLTNAELVEELKKYGIHETLPIKRHRRPILLKKLNHAKVKVRAHHHEEPDRKGKPGLGSSSRSTILSKTPGSSSNTRNGNSRSSTQIQAVYSNLDAFSSDDSDNNDYDQVVQVKTKQKVFKDNSVNYLSVHDLENDLSIGTRSRSRSSLNSPYSSKISASPINNTEKKRSPQLADGILRTLRRRTGGEDRSRRSRGSDVFEVSTTSYDTDPHFTSQSGSATDHVQDDFENNFTRAYSGRDKISSQSPARSPLYPDLKRLSTVSTPFSNDDFESSDSDLEASTYEVENKSVNTSFHHGREPVNSFLSSSSRASSSFQESPSRGVVYPRWRHGGTRRVQQYKSAISEHLPHCLLAVAMCFFITLSVVYIANHKDFFFSWFSSQSNMGVDDELLICQDGVPRQECYAPMEVETALKHVKNVFNQVSLKKGDVLCEKMRPGEDIMKASVLKDKIFHDSIASTNALRLYECCLQHILVNPHWNLRALREDGSEAKTVSEVFELESKVASMGFWCRLIRSFTTVLYGIFLFFTLVAGAVLVSVYIKYRLKKKEQEQREVFSMVEKIIEVLQEHYDRTKGEDSDEQSYLAVQHVRDQLLPPSTRRRQQPIWEKAVDFISANESRIRLETRLIQGDEFDVWHWLQPSAHNGKIWQGQAFGEVSSNNSNQTMYSPTQCLKIRNMFDSNVESEDDWEQSVIDAILEKCRGIDHIIHIFVDVDSQEGCVYIKCSSQEAAGRVRLALHGWWFDGRLVTVKHLRTDHYHKRWPDARSASQPLRPSTNQMKSLSQPYYRSTLEMT